MGPTWDDLEIEHVGRGDHPPLWAHISILAGRIIRSPAFPFRYPTNGPPVALRDGLLSGGSATPVFLGNTRWGRKDGTLVLAPSYPDGGMQADHLIFRWTYQGIEHMISIHAWAPLEQAVATLHAVVLAAAP